MPTPRLHVDDLAVVGEPDARAGHADRGVAVVVVEMVGGWNSRADDNGTAVFLQTRVVEDRELEVFVTVASRFDHRDPFGRGGSDGREDVAPVLHRHVLSVRS